MKGFNEVLDGMFLFTARPTSVQREEFYVVHFANNRYSQITHIITYPVDGKQSEWFMSTEDSERLFSAEAREFFKPNFLKKYSIMGKKYLKSWLDTCTKVNRAFKGKNVSAKEAVKAVKNFYSYPAAENSYVYFSLFPWSFERKAAPEFANFLKNIFADDFDEEWNITTSQTEIFEEQRMRVELAKLKKNVGKNCSKKDLSAIQKKYRYLGVYSPNDYGVTEDSIFRFYNELNVNETLEIPSKIAENRKALKRLLKKYSKDKKVCEMIRLVSYNVNFRTTRSEMISYGFFLLSPFYEFVAKKLNITREDVGGLTAKDIVRFLEKGKVPEKKEAVRARYYFRGKGRDLTLSEKKQFEKRFKQEITHKELKGISACAGTAKGIARIVHSEKDLRNVKRGDIMVAQFTRPEYIPAMKRAGGIVTNDGSITCHAAIISRELKKPCVVGTRVATKAFCDGDILEVDATKGIVKKVKK